jgi:hypothetical protein
MSPSLAEIMQFIGNYREDHQKNAFLSVYSNRKALESRALP